MPERFASTQLSPSPRSPSLTAPPESSSGGVYAACFNGLACYAGTTAVAFLGVIFGHSVLAPATSKTIQRGFVAAFARQDGEWYTRILTQGYMYDPAQRSSVAFFPLYPLLAAPLVHFAGLEPAPALLTISHVSLGAAFAFAALYFRRRLATPPVCRCDYALLAMGLMPGTLFFRMTYAEPLFLLLCILVLYAIARGWPVISVACLVGLATACRPVGLALVAPVVLYSWERSETRRTFLVKTALALPIACSGVVAYAAYQGLLFGEPFAFAFTQSRWGRGQVPWSEKFLALLSLQPVWEVYDPVSHFYCWGADRCGPSPLFCWAALDPVYFVLTAALVTFGAYKRWLSSYETTLAIGLLLIPYVTRSYEMAMASQSRFAAAVFPVYLVLGNVLARLPCVLAGSFLAINAFYLAAFAALFAAGERVF